MGEPSSCALMHVIHRGRSVCGSIFSNLWASKCHGECVCVAASFQTCGHQNAISPSVAGLCATRVRSLRAAGVECHFEGSDAFVAE